jgi:hypothetical protein
MRAIVVKHLRRQAYGKGTHPGPVESFFGSRSLSTTMPKCLYGCCVSDQARRDYQALKQAHHQRVRS